MKAIELTVDVMFVNKTPFVISLGKYMRFATIENVVDWNAATLLKSLRSIKSVYANKNIFIKTLYMDNKFEVLRDALLDRGITLSTTAADEHVSQTEIQIKVAKERFHSTWNSLPYTKTQTE